MSSLSNPNPPRADDPIRVINYQKYLEENARGSFNLEGEDAYWLKRLAREQDMSPDAMAKILILEGLMHRRSYLEVV